MTKEPKTYKNQNFLSTLPSCYDHEGNNKPITKELLLDVLGDYCNYYRCDWNPKIEEYSTEKLLEKYWNYFFPEKNAGDDVSSNKYSLWHGLYEGELEKDCPKMPWWVFGDSEDATDGSFNFDEKYWESFLHIIKEDSGNNTKVRYVGYGPNTDFIYDEGIVDFSDVFWGEIPNNLREELLKEATYIKVESSSQEKYRVCISRAENGFWMQNPDFHRKEDREYLWYDFSNNNDYFYFIGYKKDGAVLIDENAKLHNQVLDCR